MRHRPWTNTEIANLNRLADAGLTLNQAATEFPDRSPGAVRDFCRKHGIEFKRDVPMPGKPAPIHPSRFPDYAGMSLTARLMGDPCPARAALAQKTNGGTTA